MRNLWANKETTLLKPEALTAVFGFDLSLPVPPLTDHVSCLTLRPLRPWTKIFHISSSFVVLKILF